VAKVRLDNYSTEDFGASALITPINMSYNYIIPTNTGKMSEITETLFKDIFFKYFKMEYE
jgi:hypothetical protein